MRDNVIHLVYLVYSKYLLKRFTHLLHVWTVSYRVLLSFIC